ncbi:MAG TPA: hypothetical protein VJX92_07560 [Methylomirabilota bacterium]|nr:hypothetical protein [Methylomirabilota bacterium]
MRLGGKTAAGVLLAGLVLGALTARHEIVGPVRPPVTASVATAATPGHKVSSWLKVRQLRILGPDDRARVTIGESGEHTPGIWLTDARETATIQLGVHGNGFPYVLVSDGAVRNFGLGRVDGVQASPILVFRSGDVVRMVFGLDMVEPSRSPFLVWYAVDGAKHDVIGHYCDRPDRVCVR